MQVTLSLSLSCIYTHIYMISFITSLCLFSWYLKTTWIMLMSCDSRSLLAFRRRFWNMRYAVRLSSLRLPVDYFLWCSPFLFPALIFSQKQHFSLFPFFVLSMFPAYGDDSSRGRENRVQYVLDTSNREWRCCQICYGTCFLSWLPIGNSLSPVASPWSPHFWRV